METLNHSEKVQDQLTQSMERVSFIDKAEEVHARIGALLRAIDNPQVTSEGNIRKRADQLRDSLLELASFIQNQYDL